jgi:Thioesterase-like superfamily
MSEAFFTHLGDGRFRAEEACAGPWSPELMHGGPPSALLVRACERAAEESAPGLLALRASVDFLTPVPVGPVTVVARVVRDGRRIALTEAVLQAGERDVLHARVWHIRTADRPTPGLDQQPPASVPTPEESPATLTDWTFPYARALDWRIVGGDPVGAGPATVWSRARIPVVPDEDPSGLQRAVLSADSGNGISANLDWAAWSFVNIDLDVHLSRPLVGEWVLLDATTRYEETGTALAASSLWDARGRVGRGAQTLVVTPRRT